jgi:hypothetical protein
MIKTLSKRLNNNNQYAPPTLLSSVVMRLSSSRTCMSRAVFSPLNAVIYC